MNRIIYVVAVLVCALFSTAATAQQYCLDRPGDEWDRTILKVPLDQYVSKDSFQMRTEFVGANPSAQIRFFGNGRDPVAEPGDRMVTMLFERVVKGAREKRLLLEHTRKVGSKFEVIARSELVLEPGGRWAKGAAELKTPKGWETVGDYFMYRMNDLTAGACERDTSKGCRIFHFDFFWAPDYAATWRERPEHVVRANACTLTGQETDEGDGEEGED